MTALGLASRLPERTGMGVPVELLAWEHYRESVSE
jgi:hypothetical protein